MCSSMIEMKSPVPNFKDADLLGAPVRIAVGAKGLDQGMVEIRSRTDERSTLIPLEQIIQETMQRLESAQ